MTSWAGPAVSKIAEWVVTSVVTSLVKTAYNSYSCDRRLPDDSKAELKRLSTALPKIRAVMGIAEALKMKDPNTGLWVGQFRQAVEESQLVLNELDYLNRDEAGESSSNLKKRKRYIINDDTMKRLKYAVTMMDRATTEIDHLLRLATVLGVHGRSESRQEAGEVLRQLENQVFGREVEKHKIIDWLKRPNDAHLSSFGTTPAEIVYQNMGDQSNYFNRTILICVSTNLSVRGTTTKILVKLCEENCFGKPLNVLQEASKATIHWKNVIIRGNILIDDNHIDLQKIVDQIVKLLRGNYPLAENMVGDIMIQPEANWN